MHTIKKGLGFGKVSKYLHFSRFIVADKANIDRLINIFNGNLLLEKTNKRFLCWVNARNLYSPQKLVVYPQKENVCFGENAWLSGFIDAEGCFNSQKFKKTRYRLGFRVRFLLYQKGELPFLVLIKNFFGSSTISERVWGFTVTFTHMEALKKRYYLLKFL